MDPQFPQCQPCSQALPQPSSHTGKAETVPSTSHPKVHSDQLTGPARPRQAPSPSLQVSLPRRGGRGEGSLTRGCQPPRRGARGASRPGQGCWGRLPPPGARGRRRLGPRHRPHAGQSGPRGHCRALPAASAAAAGFPHGPGWPPRAEGWSAPLRRSATRVLGRDGDTGSQSLGGGKELPGNRVGGGGQMPGSQSPGLLPRLPSHPLLGAATPPPHDPGPYSERGC